MSTKPRVAIVIFVIGEHFYGVFKKFFEKSVRDYCKRCEYDLILQEKLFIEEPVYIKRKIYWQRLLVPSHFSQYDYVITMDSDIFISPNAPPLPLNEIPIGKIAAINERKYFNNYEWREKIQVKHGWEKTGKEWYALSGEDKSYNDHINGGVVIYQPKYHAELMKKLYEENIGHYLKYHQDDQSFLSSYLIDNNMIHWLDERYNRLWLYWKEIMYPLLDDFPDEIKKIYIQNFIDLNYFCHFNCGIDIPLIEP